jgi:hypothetical protein
MKTARSTQGSNRSKSHAKTGPATCAARVQEGTAPALEGLAPLPVESSPMKRGRQPMLPPPPDVQEVARRGGLPADILGYKFGPNWSLQSGNSTPEFNSYLILGYDKLLEDVQHYCIRVGREVAPDEIRTEFSNLAFASDGLLTDARRGTAKGKDVFNEQLVIEPKPGQWPPKAPTAAPMTTAEPKPESLSGRLATRVARKLADPKGYPVMSYAEVAHALGQYPGTIRRRVREGKLPGTKMKGRIPTQEVIRLVKPDEYQSALAWRANTLSGLESEVLTRREHAQRAQAIQDAFDKKVAELSGDGPATD